MFGSTIQICDREIKPELNLFIHIQTRTVFDTAEWFSQCTNDLVGREDAQTSLPIQHDKSGET